GGGRGARGGAGDRGPRPEGFAHPCSGDGGRRHDDRSGAMARRQIVTLSWRSAKRFSPMPRTSRSSFTDRKPPRRSRSEMIASASVGPMPGSASSSADVALLRFTSADGSAAPSPAALPPPEDGPGGPASP